MDNNERSINETGDEDTEVDVWSNSSIPSDMSRYGPRR